MQQSNIKPVSSGFKEKGLRSNLQFQTRVRKDVTEGGKREQFWKRCLKDSALRITDDGRRQLGYLQRELALVLACFPVLIVNLSILNHSSIGGYE